MMRAAHAGDIPAIMRIERLPGYDVFIGQSSAEDHAAWQAGPDSAELVWEIDGAVRGFAVLLKLTSPHTVLLKRVAVDAPGERMGTPFMRAIMAYAFARPTSHRLELDTSAENPRARHVYEKLGFVLEGRVRDVYRLDDGRYVSSDLLAILRHEWDALPGKDSAD
jgi:RimJ/RimL family protein N-acetyltransferase